MILVTYGLIRAPTVVGASRLRVKIFLRYHLFISLSRKTPDNRRCGVFAL